MKRIWDFVVWLAPVAGWIAGIAAGMLICVLAVFGAGLVLDGTGSSVSSSKMFEILANGPARYCMSGKPNSGFVCTFKMVPHDEDKHKMYVIFRAHDLNEDGTIDTIWNATEEFEWTHPIMLGGTVTHLTD